MCHGLYSACDARVQLREAILNTSACAFISRTLPHHHMNRVAQNLQIQMSYTAVYRVARTIYLLYALIALYSHCASYIERLTFTFFILTHLFAIRY